MRVCVCVCVCVFHYALDVPVYISLCDEVMSHCAYAQAWTWLCVCVRVCACVSFCSGFRTGILIIVQLGQYCWFTVQKSFKQALEPHLFSTHYWISECAVLFASRCSLSIQCLFSVVPSPVPINNFGVSFKRGYLLLHCCCVSGYLRTLCCHHHHYYLALLWSPSSPNMTVCSKNLLSCSL